MCGGGEIKGRESTEISLLFKVKTRKKAKKEKKTKILMKKNAFCDATSFKDGSNFLEKLSRKYPLNLDDFLRTFLQKISTLLRLF